MFEKFGLHHARLGSQPECWLNSRLHRVYPSAVAEARFLVAGFAADRHYAPTIAARKNPENEFDFARALQLVDEDHLQILLRETERVIISRWPQVAAVAQALLQKNVLPALDIYRVIAALRP